MERVRFVPPQVMTFRSGVISGVIGLSAKGKLSNRAVCSGELCAGHRHQRFLSY